ncbi:MAG: hypothetical protein IAE90_11400 [Ignavibacteria bacterium]|nr:hypothetical protein [Ignavibacteria bacterium]
MKPTTMFKSLILFLLITGLGYSQLVNTELKLKSDNSSDFNMSPQNKKLLEKKASLYQKPTKKIYFVPGGKIGMFFLQGDFNGNQMIALEAFGKYVGEGFWAEISIPFRFKTSPAFTDIGLDVNVMYPFMGSSNKSEIDPFVGGGLGLHFIGRDRDDPNKTTVSARGGLGLNLIAGAVFFRNYDFNIVLELKYFNYLREFDDMRYQGIGLNVGVTFPR